MNIPGLAQEDDDFPGKTTSAIPPTMTADAIANRSVAASPSSATAPKAAINGTLNCTVAACVDFSAGSAVYQIA